MNDLTLGFERMTGQMIGKGLPAGAAGEAFLAPVPGLDLAFDRMDGRLCRAVVQTTATERSIAVDDQVAALLIGLFGPVAPAALLDAAAARERMPQALTPDPGLTGTLSRLARLYATRATSPAPFDSAWWAAEADELAASAGLPAPANPPPGSRPAATSLPLGGSVAAQVERLGQLPGRRSGPQWLLDPSAVPARVFQLGLSSCSDLTVRDDCGPDRIVIEAQLTPGADCGALSRCRARLVDPGIRRILAQVGFTVSGDRAQAELRLASPLDELSESWAEVVLGKRHPVGSAAGHRIRRALRWADAALRAERAPAGLDPAASADDWSALAAATWNRCRLDWAAAGNSDRAYLAALAARRATAQKTRVPRAPSPLAAETARQVPLAGPACLAEARGG